MDVTFSAEGHHCHQRVRNHAHNTTKKELDNGRNPSPMHVFVVIERCGDSDGNRPIPPECDDSPPATLQSGPKHALEAVPVSKPSIKNDIPLAACAGSSQKPQAKLDKA